MRARRYFAVVSVIALLIAGAILLLIVTKPSTPASLSVSFTGYTNLPNNSLRFALFTLANSDRLPLRWRGVATEVEGDNNLKAPIVNSSLPWITLTPLKTGGSMTLAVGEPLDGERWRVQLRFSRCTIKERLYQFAIVHRVPPPLSRLIPSMPPIQTTNTGWLTH